MLGTLKYFLPFNKVDFMAKEMKAHGPPMMLFFITESQEFKHHKTHISSHISNVIKPIFLLYSEFTFSYMTFFLKSFIWEYVQ
jgi:hypothetical protein